MSTTTKQSLTTALLRGYFQPLARKGPLGEKLVFMFMDHKGPLCSYSQGWVATPKRQQENVLMNHPERSSWLTIQSVSSIDIPCPIDRFNLKLDCQKEGDLRYRPDLEFAVQSLVHARRGLGEFEFMLSWRFSASFITTRMLFTGEWHFGFTHSQHVWELEHMASKLLIRWFLRSHSL